MFQWICVCLCLMLICYMKCFLFKRRWTGQIYMNKCNSFNKSTPFALLMNSITNFLLQYVRKIPYTTPQGLSPHTYLVSVNHWWNKLACLANSLRNLSFSSCRWASLANSPSRSSMIFCKLRQVSSNASMVNQVYGFGPTLKLLIFWSNAANALKSASADDRDAWNWAWASRRARISSMELQLWKRNIEND